MTARYFWSKKVPLTSEMKKQLQNGQAVELKVASRAMTEHGNTQPSRDLMVNGISWVSNGWQRHFCVFVVIFGGKGPGV